VTHIPQKDEVTYLLGNTAITSTRPVVPYDALLCEFLSSLSSELRSSNNTAAYPDVMTFAFWCRKANILRLKSDFEDGKHRLGLGLVFHIAPSNVPVNFAFSFAFGLLAGNANIVKVPSKQFPQIDSICSAIGRLFDDDKYKEIKKMTAFVRYAQHDEITGMFSENCNARLLWGGNETINRIRKLPMPERGVTMAFPDRYSFCIIDADAVIKLDTAKLNQLSENFYNDTYLMDQNACSSPHLIVWQGKEKEAAKEIFWRSVYTTAHEKYQLPILNAVDKYTLLCHNAIELDSISGFINHGNHVYRVALDRLPANIADLRGKCGYFYEYNTNDINNIANIINSKYQTLTYFGVDKSKLLDFVVKNRLPGIDRIVPIGEALDMGTIWDGYDIVKSLSRLIDVK